MNIIALQLAFTLILIGLISLALRYEEASTVGTIASSLSSVHATGLDTQALTRHITTVRERTLAIIFLGLMLATVAKGFVMARFALLPTKNSLQFQKRFIGNVAHEVRTPLAIMKTNTEVALMDPALSKDIQETFTSTLTELDRISEIINNLLSFDTLVHPSKRALELVDLNQVLTTVVQRHQAYAHSRDISLSLISDGRSQALGNTVAFEQLATNLVKNAISYTPENQGGTVTVRLGSDARNRVQLQVIDTGSGIAQKDLQHILEPFYRGDSSRARGAGTGTSGLGLAIVNEIARLYHGTLAIHSTLGHGTTISVTFPRAKEGALGADANELLADFS